jgi:cation transport ATPase
MALIRCRECSREISDTAKSCPHCGYVNKATNNKAAMQQTVKEFAAVAVAAVLTVVIGAANGWVVVSWIGFGLLLAGAAVVLAKFVTQ